MTQLPPECVTFLIYRVVPSSTHILHHLARTCHVEFDWKLLLRCLFHQCNESAHARRRNSFAIQFLVNAVGSRISSESNVTFHLWRNVMWRPVTWTLFVVWNVKGNLVNTERKRAHQSAQCVAELSTRTTRITNHRKWVIKTEKKKKQTRK